MSRKRKAKPRRVCEISQPTVRHVLAAMMEDQGADKSYSSFALDGVHVACAWAAGEGSVAIGCAR
jgi:hypothetical protein